MPGYCILSKEQSRDVPAVDLHPEPSEKTAPMRPLLLINSIALLAAQLAVAANFNVNMVNFSFSPADLTIGQGDNVTWHNGSGTTHTSTSGTSCTDNSLWESGDVGGSGGSFSLTFPNAGRFPYFCAFHCSFGMTGVLTVTNGTPSDAPPTVNITTPANNDRFAAPATVTIQASAMDSDGTVTNLQLFLGTAVLANLNAAAATATASNLVAGTYTLRAIATDDAGLTGTNSVSITVTNAPTSGSITNVFSGPTNILWDLTQFGLDQIQIDVTKISHLTQTNEAVVEFDGPFTQDARGKLLGSGGTNASLTISSNGLSQFNDVVPGQYSTSGSISSAKGVARVSFQSKFLGMAQLEGRERSVSAGATYLLTIDGNANQVTGRFVQRASASGLNSISTSGSFVPASIPDSLGDGSWTLALNFGAPMGNLLNGTAALTFGKDGSQVYPFTFTGKFLPATGQSTLNLKGVNAAQNSMLQVTLGSSNTILRVFGRVSGQTVNFSSQ